MNRSCGSSGFPPLSLFVMVMLKGRLLLQPLQWCCVDGVIHHERDVHEEQPHTYMWREQAIKE